MRPTGRLASSLAALLGLAALAPALVSAQPTAAPLPQIRVVADAGGHRLQVDGRDVMVRGVNWDYFPVGTNYSYNFWGQPDDFIAAALDREMSLIKNAGMNAIRVYNGIPAKWVRYIYERYGIWTVVNHALGRYGTTVNGVYQANTDYSNAAVRRVLTAEVLAMVDELKGTPGLLMWLLGNENNYGLTWKSAETEALPVGERDAAKARYMYSLFGEVTRAIKTRDVAHPVAMANGDLQYVDIIAQETKGLDIFGSNVYRGLTFGNFFETVKQKLGIPVMFTEFGADAYNEKEGREDQQMQARYVLSQWQDIYENSAGKGRSGNAIGGFTFQWSDGWWKYGQETNLDRHDANASWPAEAYAEDFVKGENNMNEEWWGIMAKGPTDARGFYQLYPRAAYYGLKQAYTLDPYAATTDLNAIKRHFAQIEPAALVLASRGDRATLDGDAASKFRVSGMRLEMQTFSTGGSLLSTPPSTAATSNAYPSFTGFDRMESYFVDFEAKPTERFTATLSFNILGSIATNPIDEIFYENRGRTRLVQSDAGTVALTGNERLRLYRGSFSWDEKNFRLDGFNRTGHYHWGYEGDFFGLYREANYGRFIDIYNGAAPFGVEFTGKRSLSGLKAAFGPELWWGANPAALVKYGRSIAGYTITGVVQEDLAAFNVGAVASSFAVPLQPTRRATLHVATTRGALGLEVGGMWGGATKIGDRFQTVTGRPGNYQVLQDSIRAGDTFAGKAKVTYSKGRLNWYAQGGYYGLVADGGPTSTMTFTGWWLKDTGLFNQWNVLSGFTWQMGNLQIAPNFLYQKPIVGPVPGDVPAPGRPRNILADPFVVRANRETMGGELLLTWDPTPATYMHQWDNDQREDARFAVSSAVMYRRFPTTMDASIGILGDGRTTFAFPGATPARDLWEARTRMISRVGRDTRFIVNAFGGTAEPNGDSRRLVKRYGGDLRLQTGAIKVISSARVNDFGPFDYHRDFNLTFPLQLMTDVAYVFGKAQWFDVPETKFGVRGTWRSLDRYSPRYCPERIPNSLGNLVCDPTAPAANGREWEIRSYFIVAW
jgi:hypothetical protein